MFVIFDGFLVTCSSQNKFRESCGLNVFEVAMFALQSLCKHEAVTYVYIRL